MNQRKVWNVTTEVRAEGLEDMLNDLQKNNTIEHILPGREAGIFVIVYSHMEDIEEEG